VVASRHSVAGHFAGQSPSVRQVYDRILAVASKFGPVREDPKKTSIHLNRTTAFAGVATRRDYLILTLKTAHDIRSPRITNHEQVSAHRWHLELRLTEPREVNSELAAWLKEAYALSA